MNVKNIIGLIEKLFLIIIAIFTIAAMGQEIFSLIDSRRVELKDLLLMFIYAEVLGMLAAFYSSHRIPITIPLFIAMTALSRLIILQGKDGNTGRGIKERPFLDMGPVVEHCRDRPFNFTQDVFFHNDESDSGRTYIFLGAAIDEAVF